MSSWWSSAKTEVLGAALGRVLFRHGQKAFNSTSHRYVTDHHRIRAFSSSITVRSSTLKFKYMYLRKAPAAGGSHGSGTGVEFRPLVIGGCLFRYGGESPRLF
eukprot:scaffold2959_cov75-Skeletonema_marinoi.AAC.1